MPGYMKFIGKAPKKWNTGAALPGTHNTVRAMAMNGKIYAVTENGIFESNTTVSGWTKLTNLPTVKTNFGACGFGGFIFVFGGQTSSNPAGLAEAYRYHIPSGSWNTLINMYSNLYDLASVGYGNDLVGYSYIIGGSSGGQNYSARVDRNELTTAQWFQVASLSTGRAGHSAIATGAMSVYVFGGNNASGDLNTVQLFNGTNWSPLANLPFANKKMAAAYAGNYIFLTGGDNSPLSFLKYSISDNSWEQLKPMNTNKSNHGMAILNNIAYVIGGNSVEYFELD